MPVSKLQNQVAEQLESYLSKKILVAVSGGRDSMVLLHLLTEVFPIGQLMVVHVNHQLRGEESNEDAKLVSKLAETYGCDYIEYSCDVAQLSQQQKLSIEAAARKVRHQYFAKAQVQYGAEAVLLAHHADDQAETILFNLFRGSLGLKGMSLSQQLEVTVQTEAEDKCLQLNLLRPLLKVRQSLINEYQAEHDLEYREDSSNAELIYTRNRLRHEVLPLLADVMQRDVVDKVLNSYNLSHDESLDELDLDGYVDNQGRLVVSEVIILSPLKQRAIMKLYLENNGVAGLSSRLILSAVDLLTDLTKPSINLPKGGKLRRKEKRVWIEKKASE